MANAPVPGSTIPPIKDIEYSYLNDPLNYVVKVMTAFLQTVWETSDRGLFHWTPQIEETEIVITEEMPLNLDAIKHKPAIAISLGAMNFSSMTLDELASVRATDASEHHADLVPGNLVLNCLARFVHQGRFIGWQSGRTIWNLRKMLIKDGVFQEIGRRIQLGPSTKAGELVQGDTEGEWHNFPVIIPFYMQWNDTVKPLAKDWSGRPIHPLRHVEIEFSTKLAQLRSQRGLPEGYPAWGGMTDGLPGNRAVRRGLRPPTIGGRPINLSRIEPENPSAGVTQRVKT